MTIFRPYAARLLELALFPAAILVNPHKNERCKEMVKAARTFALILLLACSAQAGIIQNDRPAPLSSQPVKTPQGPTDATVEPTAKGDIQNDAASELTQVALEVLAVLPSLF